LISSQLGRASDTYADHTQTTFHSFIDSFIHSFIAICRLHYVENVESEALEAVARWSGIGKIVSF